MNKTMKTIKKILLFTFLLLNIGTGYSKCIEIPNDVIKGFEQGKSNLICKYFNSKIEFIVENSSQVYSKQQAKGILTHFFKENKVISFQTLHSGEKGTSLFIIGKLKTENKNFRIYLLARKLKNKTYIQQIRIDLLNE